MTTEKFQLTGIFVQDPDSKGFTAFFAQLPNIIAEGDTEEDATINLIHTVQAVFEHQKDVQVKSFTPDKNIITKPFNLSFA
ncbi:MAG TPA: hypothetical protein PLM81_08000 [Ginsengibacter sp.]|nr:hypothetical protein [Chitinophagaceae bacterium]MCZ2395256.1 hypothetical protein [Chitinophagales bacterium]HRN73055.1 hypothetical protein [Ginsengibacter sp.]HRP17303.1 hypothetical protein [Ginsengibacter sp.]HRP44574.1 hypothetical protein [Ginsengibacter sp.]